MLIAETAPRQNANACLECRAKTRGSLPVRACTASKLRKEADSLKIHSFSPFTVGVHRAIMKSMGNGRFVRY